MRETRGTTIRAHGQNEPLDAVRRRRVCVRCGERWTTYEIAVAEHVRGGLGMALIMASLLDRLAEAAAKLAQFARPAVPDEVPEPEPPEASP